MEWYKTEGGTAEFKPPVIDDTSSISVVYLRKDFNLETRELEEGQYQIWTYMEQQIPRQDWQLYKTVMENSGDIKDLTDAIIELAGIIGG